MAENVGRNPLAPPENTDDIVGTARGLAALADMAMMRTSLNPITNVVEYMSAPAGQPKSLQTICLGAIRCALKIRRLIQADCLPMPTAVINELQTLCLGDFRINPTEVGPEHREQKIFPALCVIDMTQVELKLTSGSVNHDDPSLITTFTCNGMTFEVHETTISLARRLEKIKEYFPGYSPYTENTIWEMALKIFNLAKTLPPEVLIKPDRMFFFKDRQVAETLFIRVPDEPVEDMTQVLSSAAVSFYEAPEILMQGTGGTPAHIWSIGCILYEIAALKPAYYDRDNTGNLMAPMTEITEGTLPPELDDKFSDDFKNIIKQCLNVDPDVRPTFEHVIEFIQSKLKLEEVRAQ